MFLSWTRSNFTNPTANAVAIGGWFLTDDFGSPKKFQIPGGTTIPARGFVVFTETNFNVGSNAFSLSSEGDELFLFSGEAGNLTGYYHGFDFGAAANGVTFGRYINSVGAEHFIAQSTNTLGATNARPRVGPVVISEFMYHPPEFRDSFGLVDNSVDEFIELHNITSAPVSLFDPSFPSNTWLLTKAVDFRFPRAASIPANGYALVVNFDPVDEPGQLAAFVSRYSVPAGTPVFGPLIGKLDNSADSIKISRPDAPSGVFVPYVELDQVDYADAAAWPDERGRLWSVVAPHHRHRVRQRSGELGCGPAHTGSRQYDRGSSGDHATTPEHRASRRLDRDALCHGDRSGADFVSLAFQWRSALRCDECDARLDEHSTESGRRLLRGCIQWRRRGVQHIGDGDGSSRAGHYLAAAKCESQSRHQCHAPGCGDRDRTAQLPMALQRREHSGCDRHQFGAHEYSAFHAQRFLHGCSHGQCGNSIERHGDIDRAGAGWDHE
jgi:hypothetical protein